VSDKDSGAETGGSPEPDKTSSEDTGVTEDPENIPPAETSSDDGVPATDAEEPDGPADAAPAATPEPAADEPKAEPEPSEPAEPAPAGSNELGQPETPSADATAQDLTPPADATAQDLTPPPDATSQDLTPPADATARDLTSPPDATAVDLTPVTPAAAGMDGPGEPPKKPKKKGSRRWKWIRRTVYVLAALLLLPIIAFVVLYLRTPIPSTTQADAKAQKSTFYYDDGKTVIARYGDFDRRPVPLSQVPKAVRDAAISAENRSFYSDPGVSITGTGRALWSTAFGGNVQGGSTITQQLVRNYYSGLSQSRTISRKLKEIMISIKVGKSKSKDWILEQYLNTIYFGRGAYGIETAAQAYYGTDVQNLTAAQGAYLAAAIQQPTTFGEPSAAAQGYREARWRYVIEGMVKLHTLTPQQAAAMKFPAPITEKQNSNSLSGVKGYMVSHAITELEAMGYSEDQINRGGLKVTTTFDKSMMAAAKNAVESTIPDGTSKNVRVGLVAVNPANGEIPAFYGGKNYLDQQFDNAFDATAQAGSGFKPYVLATALENGDGLDHQVDGSSPLYIDHARIPNDSGENFGMVNLVTATAQSINTAYVRLGQEVGLDKVTALAEKVGLPASQLTANNANTVPTFPLGVASLSVEQQAGGYATFAAGGVFHKPHVIRSVISPGGKVKTTDTTGQRAFPKSVATDATYAMQKVVDYGTGTNAALPDRNAAGKTGTTDSGKSIWFNGFIPQLTASVGIFRADNKPVVVPGYTSYGGQLPALIWKSFITGVDQNIPPKSFPPPSEFVGGSLPQQPPVSTVPTPHHTRTRPPVSHTPVPPPVHSQPPPPHHSPPPPLPGGVNQVQGTEREKP
jgi:membrane peptidoglycan carboxypeptidase